MRKLRRSPPLALAAVILIPAFILSASLARAQVPVYPGPPVMPGTSFGAAASCRTTVRYFGKGSLTTEYPLDHVGGEYPWMVPPHAVARLVSHTGPMWGPAFFQSQRWQRVRQLGLGACRFLSRHRPVMHMTVTDRHGRRVGLIVARMIVAGMGPSP